MRGSALSSVCGRHICFLFALGFFCFSSSILAQDSGPTADPVTSASKATADGTKPSTNGGPKTIGGVKVDFETGIDGIVIVESNGEKLRIDTVHKTVEKLGETALATAAPTPPTQAQANEPVGQKKSDTKYSFGKGWEPYDVRVVNMPTPKYIPKGSWNIEFTHRFTQPIRPLDKSAPNLFGLDSFGIASFGVTYGVTDKLYLRAYRSPVCQKGICKDIEIGAGYNWIASDEKHPLAVSTYVSIEGNDNFTEEYTYNLQTMIAGRAAKRVYLFFSPAVHINSNGQGRFDPRASDYFPPATAAVQAFHLPTHGATFAGGAEVLVTPNVVLLFDAAASVGFKVGNVVPILDSSFRVTGFNYETHPAWGFGVQRNIGKHAFALTFSNTQTTTTSKYNSSNVFRDWKFPIIGFNLSRRF